MNGTDTFFYTWLSQLRKIAALNEQVQAMHDKLEKQDDWDNEQQANTSQMQADIKELQAEIVRIKDAAAQNKAYLVQEVRAAKNQSVIINPKENNTGLAPASYHLYLKGDDLEYVTM